MRNDVYQAWSGYLGYLGVILKVAPSMVAGVAG